MQGSNLHLLHWQVDSLPLKHPDLKINKLVLFFLVVGILLPAESLSLDIIYDPDIHWVQQTHCFLFAYNPPLVIQMLVNSDI